jgi:hypothetical protein
MIWFSNKTTEIKNKTLPCTVEKSGGGRWGEGNNFDQKPFGRELLFLPVRGKNLMTDTDDIIANKK